MDEEDTETISPNEYSWADYTKGDLTILGYIVNLGINTVTYGEAQVGGMSIDDYDMEDAPETEIRLPGGIEYGVSTEEDIIAAYGTPSDTYEGDLYKKLTYEYDSYREWELYIYNESGVLEEIDMRNFVVDEEANAEAAAAVSSEPTEEVLAYTTPEELGDDPMSFTVEFAGDLYQLPVPVSVFLENGWKLMEEYSDTVISGYSFGWVYLLKDNQEFRSIVRNYNPNAAVLENCFVVSVEGDVNGTNLPITIPGGVSLGMSNEEVLAALEGVDYEMDDESSDYYIYYTLESKESSLDGIEILVDKEEEVVTSIEVEYEPDTLS